MAAALDIPTAHGTSHRDACFERGSAEATRYDLLLPRRDKQEDAWARNSISISEFLKTSPARERHVDEAFKDILPVSPAPSR
jgi:hypothetical protein